MDQLREANPLSQTEEDLLEGSSGAFSGPEVLPAVVQDNPAPVTAQTEEGSLAD